MTSRDVRVGFIGSGFARRVQLPALALVPGTRPTAVASGHRANAEAVAREFGLPHVFTDGTELARSPDVDLVIVSSTPDTHARYAIAALEAGKHVLCEKPIGLNAAEVVELMRVRDRINVKIGEAFMVKTHQQWLRVRELIRSGKIGQLKSIITVFSYFNRDPGNVRHKPEWGGGGLLDIGSYPITLSRWLFDEEPKRVTGALELDPGFGTDRLASGIMEFSSGHSVFFCGTQTNYFQRMEILGTTGRLAVEIPFNAPSDRATQITVADGMAIYNGRVEVEEIPACDQYTIQGDAFSRAIREDTEVPVPLEDAHANMKVIDAVFRSAKTNQWERP